MSAYVPTISLSVLPLLDPELPVMSVSSEELQRIPDITAAYGEARCSLNSGGGRLARVSSCFRVLSSKAPVDPRDPMLPVLIAANAVTAIPASRRYSAASTAKRSWMVSAWRRTVLRWADPNAATASAIALSRQRFSVRNSSVEMNCGDERFLFDR